MYTASLLCEFVHVSGNTLPSCSPNYPHASRIGWTHARHCSFVNRTSCRTIQGVVPLSHCTSRETRKKKIGGARPCKAIQLFLAGFFLVSLDGLRERGTTRSLGVIMLVISNRSSASCWTDFEIGHATSSLIALHSVQLITITNHTR